MTTAPLSRWRKRWNEKYESTWDAHWRDEIVLPLAKWINRHCFENGAEVKVSGPGGLAARCFLDFTKDGKTYTITLEPELDMRGLYFRRTLWGVQRTDIRPYPPNSIGAINHLDTATEDMPPNPTPQWFLDRFHIDDDSQCA